MDQLERFKGEALSIIMEVSNMTKEVRANQVSIAQLLQEKPLDSTEIIPKYVEGRIKLCKGQK